jgi:hypothetical protein
MQARVTSRRRDAPVEESTPAFELSWRRAAYRILATPEGLDGPRWLARLPEQRVPFTDPQPSEPWVFISRETAVRGSAIYGRESSDALSAAETINVYRLAWPAGGMFVPVNGARSEDYDPLPEARETLVDVQHAAASVRPESLLGFVNRWGLLGVGICGADDFPTDGVQETADELGELVRWMAAVHALQQRQRVPETWADVAALFRQRLAGVHLQARVTPRSGLVPSFRVPRLIDGLYLELWDVATRGTRLLRCKRCEDFFIRGRDDQIFCTSRCARLWHVKRWKQRQRANKRRQARQSHHRRGS